MVSPGVLSLVCQIGVLTSAAAGHSVCGSPHALHSVEGLLSSAKITLGVSENLHATFDLTQNLPI